MSFFAKNGGIETFKHVVRLLDQGLETHQNIKHNWSPWVTVHDHNTYRRVCADCGYYMQLATEVIASKDPDQIAYLLGNAWKTIPHCGSTQPVEPEPELEPYHLPTSQLTEDELQAVYDWLNDENLKPNKTEYRILEIARHRPLTSTNWSAQDLIEPVAINPWIRIVVDRRVIKLNEKWWMDVAVMRETGEPVATVSHEGNFDEYYAESTSKKEKNGT